MIECDDAECVCVCARGSHHDETNLDALVSLSEGRTAVRAGIALVG